MEIRNCSATALVSQPLLALHYSIPHTAYVPATATGDAFTSALNVRTQTGLDGGSCNCFHSPTLESSLLSDETWAYTSEVPWPPDPLVRKKTWALEADSDGPSSGDTGGFGLVTACPLPVPYSSGLGGLICTVVRLSVPRLQSFRGCLALSPALSHFRGAHTSLPRSLLSTVSPTNSTVARWLHSVPTLTCKAFG